MKLLIAEDDSIIMKGLLRNTDWKDCGISDIETAADGEIALDKLSGFDADILITDINMPFMDGLELTEQANKIRPDMIVIILTGYDTFDYAKRALQLGVMDYLMKPVRTEDLKACVLKASDVIRHRKEELSRLEKSRSLLRSDSLENLFVHGIMDDDLSNTSILNSNGKGSFTAAIARIEDYENGAGFSLDSDEMSYRILEYCDQKLGEDGFAWIFGGEYIHFIIRSSIADGFLDELRHYASESAGTNLVISAGNSAESVSDIRRSAEEAFSIQRRFGIISHDTVIYASSLDKAGKDAVALSGCMSQLKVCLEEGKAEECIMVIGSVVSASSIEDISGNLMLMMFHISEEIRLLKSQNIIADDAYDPDKLIPEFYSVRTSAAQRMYLEKLISNLCSLVNDSSASDPINEKMVEYIAEKYRDPMLSLTVLGDYMSKSPVYLSSIFKKKNGISFSQYLTDLRFTEACRLLKTTQMRNYEISAAVGISNAQYFCSRFRRIYGCTPQEYREQ